MQFIITASFPVSPSNIYEAWLSSELHAKMTGGDAIASNEEGAEFSAWDGYISGKNLALEQNRRIKQTWRTTEFSDTEQDSIVEIELLSYNEGCILTLIHTELPEHGEQYRNGWNEHYFKPMLEYFSK